MKKIKRIPSLIFRWALTHKLFLCKLIFLALMITPVIIVTRTWLISHTEQRPSDTPDAFVLEEQTEGFTCGLHAISTVYRAYGLGADEERLRRRMGVDVKAVFYVPDSTGTLHPDMYMVLAQDFFDVYTLDNYGEVGWAGLVKHLDEGHPAVLLIKRRENGNLHWVVATRTLEADTIEIYDSLFDGPYAEAPDFLSEFVVTTMLVKPTADGEMAMSSVDAHLAGMSALTDATKRMQALEKGD
ncbi:MAG: hypothetical protein AB8C95_05545 [Phycisphaeraceae bacterium]